MSSENSALDMEWNQLPRVSNNKAILRFP